MTTDAPFDRLAAMVVLLTQKKKLGLWALNKLLWFADIAHLLLHGRTISGATYVYHGYGPTPLEIHIVRRALVKKALLKEYAQESERFKVFFYQAKTRNICFRLLKQEFSASEFKVLKVVAANLCARTGTDIHAMYLQIEPWVSASCRQDGTRPRKHVETKLRQWMDSIGLLQPEP
jgi:hypothetical protein